MLAVTIEGCQGLMPFTNTVSIVVSFRYYNIVNIVFKRYYARIIKDLEIRRHCNKYDQGARNERSR
jgi:hypothetical protein